MMGLLPGLGWPHSQCRAPAISELSSQSLCADTCSVPTGCSGVASVNPTLSRQHKAGNLRRGYSRALVISAKPAPAPVQCLPQDNTLKAPVRLFLKKSVILLMEHCCFPVTKCPVLEYGAGCAQPVWPNPSGKAAPTSPWHIHI